MPVVNKKTGLVLVEKVKIADTPLSRMTGLLTRTSLPQDEGLLITQCQSIHMFFMRFAIDVIFADKSNHVVGLVRNIKPFHLSRIFFKASYALETAVGVIDEKNVSLGDELEIVDAEKI